MNRQVAAGVFIGIVVLLTLYLVRTANIEGFMPTTLPFGITMCGVDMPSCTDTKRCINGYCTEPNPPSWPKETDLPIRGPAFSPPGENSRYNNYIYDN